MTKVRQVLIVLTLAVLSAGVGIVSFYYFHGGISLSVFSEPPTLRKEGAFSLPDVTGQVRNSSEWLGKVVILNFWAPWCSPCRKEIPGFLDLYHTYRDKGLVVVGVAIDKPDEVLRFVADFSVDYPNLLGEEFGLGLVTRYGNRSGGLPYTVVIDREGKVIYTRLGELSVTDAERVIRPLL
ncbi:cytochrome c biogenesis protein CcmG, thiol:disulfide interchange protein DsbE [Gammaproteobacteria bacterium]